MANNLVRSSTLEDLNFILQAELQASKDKFVTLWSKEKHLETLKGQAYDYFIIEDEQPVGYMILGMIEDNFELMRIVITKPGCGYGKKAINWVKDYAFNSCNAHRLWLDVRSHNTYAKRLYSHLGFVLEGTLRESIRYKEGHVSLEIMSILRGEYV